MREEGGKSQTETSLWAEPVPAQEPDLVWYLQHVLIMFPKNPVSVNIPLLGQGSVLGAQEVCWIWGLCPAVCIQHTGSKDRKSFKFIQQ